MSSNTGHGGASARRVFQAMNLALFLLGLAVIVVALNFFAQREEYRSRFDATKTRAYSLSQQTQQLLKGLRGPWKIALVASERTVNRAMRRQIDEVLKRYAAAAPGISVMWIDPENPQTLDEYDALLVELQALFKDSIGEYDRALDAGAQAVAALRVFAQQQSGAMDLVTHLPADDSTRNELQQRLGVFSLLGDQAPLITSAVDKARRTDAGRPLPDFETARSILAQALTQWAGDADELAGLLGKWLQRPNLEVAARQTAAAAQRDFQRMSQRLAEAADPLKRLAPLELSAIGTQLQQGEVAIIISPTRAAVIPSAQLLPKSNLKKRDDGGVTFDQRFRGEQLISAAIRSLTVPSMPLVVFVHGEDGSMLRPRDKQADLVGVTQILKASRYEVAEWNVATQGEQPVPARGQPVVWVIVPPPQRQGIEITRGERALLAAVQQLIADGEPVLLSVYPSLVARYRQSDPWAELAAPLGLKVDTMQVVYESMRGAGDRHETQRGQAVQDFPGDHLIARAVNGQQAYFALAMSIQLVGGTAPENGVQRSVIAAIAPGPERWLERNWTADPAELPQPTDQQRFGSALPIVMTAQRGGQRMVLVGSGGWMLSYIADVVVPIGGGRIAVVNPGNYELMLASVSWLAGMDDLIAAGPLSQEIARLRDITPQARVRWMWIAVAVLPGACVLLGLGVWIVRRR